MTLIEIIVLILMIFATAWGADAGFHRLGWPGLIVGAALGFGAWFVFLAGLPALGSRIWPRRPRCRNGKCGPKDYRVVRPVGPTLFECRCGDTYSRRGRSFFEIPAGSGEPRLYARLRILGGWRRLP
jgi:hypothetical protein